MKNCSFCILNFSFWNHCVWEVIGWFTTGREPQLTTGRCAERTKHDFRCPICCSAIVQASCLICAPSSTDDPVLLLNQPIKHVTQCLITRWNTSKFVKNSLLRVVFSTLFSVFHLVMKHYVSCSICYIYDSQCRTTLCSIIDRTTGNNCCLGF